MKIKYTGLQRPSVKQTLLPSVILSVITISNSKSYNSVPNRWSSAAIWKTYEYILRIEHILCTTLYLVNNFCLTLNLLVLLMQLPSCKCNVRYFYLVQDYASTSNYNLIKVINVYALGKHSVICRHLSFSCLPILVVIYALLSTSKYPQVTSLAILKLCHYVANGTVFSASI